jgi:hypothetical protein
MTVTVENKKPLVVPPSVQRRAGLTSRSQLEFRASRGVITITAKPPAAEDEYTPTQRRAIDARLMESAEHLKKGRVYGPFDTADQAIKFLQREIRTRKATSRKTAKR